MSKLIATRAIRGAHKLVERAEKEFKAVLEEKGPDTKVEFPDTGYFLPIAYGFLGMKIDTLGGLQILLDKAKSLLHPIPEEKLWLPYLGHVLDAGVATLFADEIIEAVKYTQDPIPYFIAEDPDDDHLWLGAADDKIMRERGIEFVDGSAPGFAAILGYCKDNKTAVKIARQLQEKNLYTFMSCATEGKSFAQQLREEGVQLGWNTRLVPFGDDVTATIHALGFASRAAFAFGGVEAGDYSKMLRYNRLRVFAFALAFGPVTDEIHAQAAGAINYGFPALAEEDIEQILVTGLTTYEHVVSPVPADEIVDKAIEVRGLKVQITEVPVPVSYSPAFEGERIKRDDMQVELGGPKSTGFEMLRVKSMDEVEDGKIEIIGPDLEEMDVGATYQIGTIVEVAGRKMQEDFEPILERRIHDFINQAQGLFHMGQRDIVWMRISKEAFNAGIRLHHLGDILHAKMHSDFGAVVDKVQVKIYTDQEKVQELVAQARDVFNTRDERVEGMTDESVEVYYSCSLCQSFAPNHVCVITPQHPGLCGAYNWLDGRAAYEITPSGPNQPIKKGKTLDEKLGQWEGVNAFIYEKSSKNIERMSAYSMMEDPMTSCGCFESICAILPMTNGIMIVDRDYSGETPSGMKFSTMAGTVGGGLQTPGFMGHSKRYVASPKYMSADGGFKRIVWMPKKMKEEIKDLLQKRCDEAGIPDFIDKIADEEVGTTEEAVLEHLQKVEHPALSMDPMM
jgi:acetyl-CoA synthase